MTAMTAMKGTTRAGSPSSLSRRCLARSSGSAQRRRRLLRFRQCRAIRASRCARQQAYHVRLRRTPLGVRNTSIVVLTSCVPHECFLQVPESEQEKEVAEATEDLTTCSDFEHVVVTASSALMNGVRLCKASINDHFFDSYRIGLGMPFRPCPSEEPNADCSD